MFKHRILYTCIYTLCIYHTSVHVAVIFKSVSITLRWLVQLWCDKQLIPSLSRGPWGIWWSGGSRGAAELQRPLACRKARRGQHVSSTAFPSGCRCNTGADYSLHSIPVRGLCFLVSSCLLINHSNWWNLRRRHPRGGLLSASRASSSLAKQIIKEKL